ncbi:MAG: NAD(P)H-hydrate dehydratase [Victivallaceae bacterium]
MPVIRKLSNAPDYGQSDSRHLIARNPEIIQRSGSAPLIMTPHPGELTRLQQAFSLPQTISRIEAAQQMASYCNAIVVLKGARTVIAAPDGLTAFNGSGSPALATAGSGDVLAGVIAATAGKQRGQKLFNAVCTAVFLHGLAGELHPDAERSVIADDLPLLVAKALKTIMPRA